ncbi:MAG: polysaccharide biosynthesis tyrosine autokinase [Fuscovulum sp.]|nr:MAG: polysaccharide biosynthesis tyrosine autokinase [Fuscovulum sp.]
MKYGQDNSQGSFHQLEGSEIDLKAILAILYRQRSLLVATVVVILAAAAAYLIVATPIYRSTVLIQVDGRSSNLLDPNLVGQEQSAVLNSRVDSEVEILRSDATALAVILEAGLVEDAEYGPRLSYLEKLGIALGTELDGNSIRRIFGLKPRPEVTSQDIVKSTLIRFKENVSISRRGLTYLIAISVSSSSPERAARIANMYAKVYIERQVTTKTQATLSARDVLRNQIETAQADLSRSESAVNSFIEVNLVRLESETGNPEVSALRIRLNEAKAAQSQSKETLASAESALQASDYDTLAEILGDQALSQLAQQRRALEARLSAVQSASSEAIDLQSELASLEVTLSTTSDEILSSIRSEIDTTREREIEARQQLRGVLLESDLSADMLTQLFNLQQSATIARNQYQTLLSREQDLGTLANLQIADARVVSEALPPTGAALPNVQLIIMFALLGGVGFGTVFAFLKEFYIGGVVSPSQLSNILQATVPVTFGTLNVSGGTVDPADIPIDAPMSVYAESFRKLRAAIDIHFKTDLNSADDREKCGRVILVCSALQAEGKSTTAIALARTYALAGVHTLLIDADMRKPSIAGRIKIETKGGLISYLANYSRNPDQTTEAMHDPASTAIVVPAGARSSVPTDQLLDSEGFKRLMKVAKNGFDIIVIDSPPILPVVDTRYLARFADVVVQVVRYATTTQGEIREASLQLREHMPQSAHYVGVLNLEEGTQKRYGYYGNYSYYGSDSP